MGESGCPYFSWAWATFVSWLTFAACAFLLAAVEDVGVISYALGDWAPPLGYSNGVAVDGGRDGRRPR